jgi:hypothetical protein
MTTPNINAEWWVVCPPSEQLDATIPPDAKIISTNVGSAAYNTLLSNGTVNGEVRYMGPFATQAEAKAAAPGKITIGDWTGAAITGLMAGAGNSPNPAANVGTGMAAGTAIDKIASFNLGSWFLRIGEILLGLVLIGVGVARITGSQNVISKAMKVGLP